MGDVSPGFLYATAVFDLGGLGVVLPSLTRTKPGLTVLAALGCAALQACAVVFHFSRGEAANTPFNFFLIALSLFVAWGTAREGADRLARVIAGVPSYPERQIRPYISAAGVTFSDANGTPNFVASSARIAAELVSRRGPIFVTFLTSATPTPSPTRSTPTSGSS